MLGWMIVFALLAALSLLLSFSGIAEASLLKTLLVSSGILFILLLLIIAVVAKRIRSLRKQ